MRKPTKSPWTWDQYFAWLFGFGITVWALVRWYVRPVPDAEREVYAWTLAALILSFITSAYHVFFQVPSSEDEDKA